MSFLVIKELFLNYTRLFFFCCFFQILPNSATAAPKNYSLSLKVKSSQSVEISWKLNRVYAKSLKKVCIQRESDGSFFSIACFSPKKLSHTLIDSDLGDYFLRYRLLLLFVKKKASAKLERTISLPEPTFESTPIPTLPSPTETPPPVTFISACPLGFPDDVISQINKIRTDAGLKQLSYNVLLALAADKHARFMAETSTLTHDGWSERIIETGFKFSSLGQNIAYTQGGSGVSTLVASWMDSPSHRKNILNPISTLTGVSCADDNKGSIFWAQNFGTPDS